MVLTTTFLDEMLDAALDRMGTGITHMAVGTGTTAAQASDTTLETEVTREALVSSTRGTSSFISELFLDTTEGNGNTFTEAGDFDASTGGNMWSRFTFTGVAKTATNEMWVVFEKTVSVTEA